MRKLVIFASTLAIAGCSAEPAPEPVEQIIVREPGAEPVAPAAENAAESEDGSAAALVANGKTAFAICSGCHVIEQDAASTAGPNLYNILGRTAGALDDFAYSEAMTSSGITWTEAELDAYIANPAGKLPGTSMVAGALGDADKRAAVIAYIKDASNN